MRTHGPSPSREWLRSLFRCVVASIQRTAERGSFPLNCVCSPVRKSHTPDALVIPGYSMQVSKLIALFLSDKNPHKASLGITAPL